MNKSCIIILLFFISFVSCTKYPKPPEGYGNKIELSTSNISNITSSTAVSGGNITSDRGDSISKRGVCWGTSTNPTINDKVTVSGTGIGTFVSSITGLLPVTTYYVRAYATNRNGSFYGNEQSFKTLAALSTITTDAVSSITQTSAVCGGNISTDGGTTITQRGVCWATTQNPTTANSKTSNGSGIGSFSSNITALTPGTAYYVRAYATSAVGTAYGNEVNFTTSITLPTVSTNSISSITLNSAIGGGDVTSTGGATVTLRGICWATTSTPTTANAKTIDGSGIGSYISNITSLNPGITYYVRAYATSIAGTAYGSQISFSTPTLGVPILSLPINGASVARFNINFVWSSIAGATSYEINVSKSNSFSGTIFSISACGGGNPRTTGVNSATVSNPTFCMTGGNSMHTGIWYWRVRAFSGSNAGAWSGTWSYNYTN